MFWLWMAVQTQWKVSDGVKHALDYPGVKIVMEMREVQKSDRGAQFSQIQMMEHECLNEWARNRK